MFYIMLFVKGIFKELNIFSGKTPHPAPCGAPHYPKLRGATAGNSVFRPEQTQ
jgi:hypothetical protein